MRHGEMFHSVIGYMHLLLVNRDIFISVLLLQRLSYIVEYLVHRVGNNKYAQPQ